MDATLLNYWLSKHVVAGSKWLLRCPSDIEGADDRCVVMEITGYNVAQQGEWDIQIAGFSILMPDGWLIEAPPHGQMALPHWYLPATGQSTLAYVLPGVKFQELVERNLLEKFV